MRRFPKITAIELIVLLGIAFLVFSIVAPVLHRMRETSTTLCIRNLNHLGLAMLLYADGHDGATPDSFATILRTQDVTPDIFICQEDDATPAKDAASFSDGPAHCSFVYVGDRMPMPYKDIPADAVIAFDREDNHEGDGVNVLFGDGRTFFLQFAPRGQPPAEWLNVRSQIARGVRPVLLPPASTQPTR